MKRLFEILYKSSFYSSIAIKGKDASQWSPPQSLSKIRGNPLDNNS